MTLNWEKFTPKEYNELQNAMQEGVSEDRYVGSVYAGTLCIDILVTKGYSGPVSKFAIFAGNIDTGYGYTESNVPYDNAGEYTFITTSSLGMYIPYEKFQTNLQRDLESFLLTSEYSFNGVSLKEMAESTENIEW